MVGQRLGPGQHTHSSKIVISVRMHLILLVVLVAMPLRGPLMGVTIWVAAVLRVVAVAVVVITGPRVVSVVVVAMLLLGLFLRRNVRLTWVLRAVLVAILLYHSTGAPVCGWTGNIDTGVPPTPFWHGQAVSNNTEPPRGWISQLSSYVASRVRTV